MTSAIAAPDPGLVPELLITDLDKSLDFWCRLCGFAVLYHRFHEGFAYIARGTVHIMLEQAGVGRNWITGPLEHPFGRGINFQISVPSIDPLVKALEAEDWPLFVVPETTWYRTGEHEAGVTQFLVADPDGYLIRFQETLERRLVPPESA